MANGKKGKGRSQNQRLKLFYLLEETDETHTKKVQEIIEHFDNYHKIPVEQKTVCSDLHLLDEYGYETQYDGRTRGWWIVEREFETQDLQLLIDSVQSSRFITQKKATELTDKLKAKASRFDRVLLDRRCYVPNRVRSQNNSIFCHLDDLHTAIANDWRITFKYFYFTPKKQKAYYKKGERYTASPYALLWSDNNYYLLAYEGGKMKHFRVDKMDNIEVLPQKREGKEVFKEMKLSERSLRMFSMFSGKVQGFYTLSEKTAPEGYVKSDEAYGIAIWNGVVHFYDEAAETDDDRYSEYEQVTFVNNAAKPAETPPESSDSPQTGSNGMMYLWIALLFVSGLSAAGITVYSRKKNHSAK